MAGHSLREITMRRSDKEIKDPELIQEILNQSEVCRIALCNDGKPYIVPMNFSYQEQTLYLHSATQGRKIDILRKNNNLCFQVDIETGLVTSKIPCNWGMRYLSVIGSGKAHFLHELADKKEALDLIMNKYSPGTSSHPEKTFQYSDEALNSVIVIKVEIEEITGKKSGF
jgi:nitroimidazol reductase NimA-like FMN-containing flavoprotein (pyridoxamine 5'-phosphate oxidase superfamily)